MKTMENKWNETKTKNKKNRIIKIGIDGQQQNQQK